MRRRAKNILDQERKKKIKIIFNKNIINFYHAIDSALINSQVAGDFGPPELIDVDIQKHTRLILK